MKDVDYKAAIEAIKKRLEEPAMNRFCNAQVKIGYTEAIEVLENKVTEYSAIRCKGDQARCIVALAIDYQVGQCSFKLLTRVPIKKR